MSIIEQLHDSALYGPVPCPVAADAAELLREIRDYLVSVADGCIDTNQSARRARELLDNNFK